jgi:hypothetical protein
MGRHFVLFLVMVVSVNSHLPYAAAKKAKAASGSPSPSAGKNPAKSVNGNTSPAHFPITQDYCDGRPPYSYSPSAVPGLGVENADIPTKAIPDLRTKFTDDGSNILTNPSSTFPLADGSDSSRLLVRAFGAGTCNVRLSIAPANISIPAGQAIKFVPVWLIIRDEPSVDRKLDWSLNPDDNKGTYGSIKDGTYTAPPNVPDTRTITVTATSHSISAVSASAQVTITTPGLMPPSIVPSQVSVREGDTIQFTALGTGGKEVTWGGTKDIDPTGQYRAPQLTADNSDKKTPIKVIVTATVSTGNAPPPVTATVTVTPAFNLLDAQYYVINIVRWKRQASSYLANSNEWYIFNTSDKSVVHQSPFGSFHPNVSKASDTRIFGSNKIGFLAVHLRSDDISQQDFKSLHINYNVKATQIQPMNVQDVQALLQLIGVGAPAETTGVKEAAPKPPPPPSPTPTGLYGGGPLTNGLDSLPAKLTFEADVSFPSNTPGQGTQTTKAAKDAPAPGSNSGNGGDATTPGKGGSTPACDSAPSSTSKTQASCTLTQSVTDEGLHRWDVSAGVPFNALNQYSFASTDGTVTQKSNAKLNAYGFFDLYPFHGADLAGPPWSSYPHLMVGLPFSGKVFNSPFVGMGFLHLKQLPVIGKLIPLQANLYAGWLIEKEFKPKMLTVGSKATTGALANDLKSERDWKPQFGIEFSILSLKKAATSSASKQSTGSTKSQ